MGDKCPHTGQIEGRYELWPLNAEQRQGVRIERSFGKKALLASPALQEWIVEGILARLAQGPTAVLVWVYDAEAGERRVRQNTMPAWWREPCNTLALCQAWEVQDHANPLPLGWEEFESNGPFEQVAAKLAAE